MRLSKHLMYSLAILGAILFLPKIAQASFEVTANATSHTIVFPLERSFRFIATLKNIGTTEEKVSLASTSLELFSSQSGTGWFVLFGPGWITLAPGESQEWVATFEPQMGPENVQGQQSEISKSFPLVWESRVSKEQKSLNIDLVSKQVDVRDASQQVKVQATVLDKETNQPINKAKITATLASGQDSFKSESDQNGAFKLEVFDGQKLAELYKEYDITYGYDGYYLLIEADGYQPYFLPGFLPTPSSSGLEEKIYLEPLKQTGQYSKISEYDSGFSIWWIRFDKEQKYVAISQGAHEQSGQTSPDQTKVYLFTIDGKKLWENTAAGECWGLDISPDAQYVTVGCHDGKITTWDRNGKELWSLQGSNSRARWIRYSPDNKTLITGPVNNTPEEFALIEASSGKILWSKNLGDHLRSGVFTADGEKIIVGAGNGMMVIFDKNGKQLFQATHGGYIPFMTEIAKEAGMVATVGKGRTIYVYDYNNFKLLWKKIIDQTATGQVADDGSILIGTVGGSAYRFDKNGQIIWHQLYGSVGHNGVYLTKNGKYSFFGGVNPTLFDEKGGILWQREPGKKAQLLAPGEALGDSANMVAIIEDGSTLIIGTDQGKIQFYQGGLQAGSFSTQSSDQGQGWRNFIKKTPFLAFIGLGLLVVTAVVIALLRFFRRS